MINITPRLFVTSRLIIRNLHSQTCLSSMKATPKKTVDPEALKYYHQTIQQNTLEKRTTFNYIVSLVFIMGGFAFLSVPLFDSFCKVTNFAGTLNVDLSNEKSRRMKRVDDRVIQVVFIADKNSYLQWKFQPLQSDIKVAPGETVLAFYSAENITDKPISGISTYSVIPYEAAKYFTKIQCFCFDEQRLNPHEKVDMPVFFYIDPDYVNDPYLCDVDQITLSYTFFEAIDGLDLPFMSSFRDDYDEN